MVRLNLAPGWVQRNEQRVRDLVTDNLRYRRPKRGIGAKAATVGHRDWTNDADLAA